MDGPSSIPVSRHLCKRSSSVGTSLGVETLVVKILCAFPAEGMASIPGQGVKIPHASRPKNQNIKQKQYCNRFNKDFKNGPH